jgi:RNA polymerase sigma factor (sigma-70 family)
MHTEKFNIIIPPQDIDDNPQCLTRIAAGDRQAFEWLYKNYCKKVFDLAFLLTANREQSDDIVQDVFVKIWMQREKLADVTSFNNWLHITTRNYITDYWRREKRGKIVFQNIGASQSTIVHPDYNANESKQIHAAAVSQLTPRQQVIYKLVREEGFSRNQVSEGLNISPCTVKATMQKALAGLKKRLEPVV